MTGAAAVLPAAAAARSGGQGLNGTEAATRLARDGPNVLPAPRRHPLWRQLGAQFVHFFAILLWVAGALALIARLPELGVAIFAVILVNAFFAFAQEFRAERAAESLRRLLPMRATVLRDGRLLDIDAADIVVGDHVVLIGGDRIPADILLVEAHSILVDSSTLSGESAPAEALKGDTVFGGTFVTEGEGKGIVTGTGTSTRLARIAALTTDTRKPEPPLAIALHRLVRTIAVIAVAVGSAFFIISVALGTPPDEGYVFAIGVTVALVPEALLPTVTLSLAIGAQHMAAKHALVRKLEAVETLGSTTFICTDKTGTLTINQMSVVRVWTPQGVIHVPASGYEPKGEIDVPPDSRAAVEEVALVAVRCSSGRAVMREGEWIARGDPMDAAVDVFARRLGLDVDADAVSRPPLHRFPFDPRRRRMSVVTAEGVMVKGAPEAVLPLCRGGGDASTIVRDMTESGLRVLAVAHRVPDTHGIPGSIDEAETDLVLIGLIGLEDPPRVAAADALIACRRAGIKVAMVTGDHPSTAAAIAREVGLSTSPETIVVGSDLPPDEGDLGRLIDRDGIVIARVDPEDKLRIARALHARGHVVAMTGDGVNDGPALQEADIGIAMGSSGTDVARDAADLVLLDDDFSTIVAAIGQGRTIFSNARRFLTYHLTDNVAEVTPFLVWALSGGRFPLALGVMQILALDIGTDTFSAVALGAEPPTSNALVARPSRGRLLDRSAVTRSFGLMGPTEAMMAMGAFVASLMASGWRLGDEFPHGAALATASGATFATIVVAQKANAFACRSTTRWPGSLGWFSNPLLVAGATIELVIAGLLFLPPIARALDHSAPSVMGWTVALASAPVVLLVDAAYKARARAKRPGRTT